jgi:hypothetical protein
VTFVVAGRTGSARSTEPVRDIAGVIGRRPEQPGLIADLDKGHCFRD